MHCEDARDALLEALDRPQEDRFDAALDAHLADCADCRGLQQDLTRMSTRATVWHELAPPAWNPLTAPRPGASTGDWLAAARTWFAPVASALALLLALGVYWQAPAGGAATPQRAAPALDRTPAADLRPISADGAGLPGDDLLAAARAERQQALEALTALLKAEMDRRSVETEQSLKYIISHQIQSQRQLEALRSRLADPPAPGERL